MKLLSRTLVALALALRCGAAAAEDPAPADAGIRLIRMGKTGVTLAFAPPAGLAGTLDAALLEVPERRLVSTTVEHRGRPVEVALSAEIDPEKPASYFLRYRYAAADPWRQQSLFFLSPQIETIVLGQREYLAGTRPTLRVVVRDRARGTPVAGAAVAVALAAADGGVLSTRALRTDAHGLAPVVLELPAEAAELRLRLEVAADAARDTVEEPIRVVAGTRTLLTTDKPLYQPGQTMHLRALSLARPALRPLARADVTFEVEDAKGNKVFKKRAATDEFGVSHADFVLADEVNEGEYRIRHLVGDVREEKTVRVERYVLPKFKVQFQSDRRFYRPGETVKGEVQADYFFGKPVAGAKVAVACAKFDVAYEDFLSIDGKTDANGHFGFEAKLPDHFVGQPLEQGKASAKLEITLIDTADHREQIVRNVPVTASPILVAAVPEGGDLVPGLENRVYLVTTYADSTPASCRVTWSNPPGGGAPRTVQTDAGGFGELALAPPGADPVSLKLAARDAQGASAEATVELKARKDLPDDRLLLRTDRALARVGGELALSVASTRKTGTVYLDVLKDRQTVLTRTVELGDGRASDRLALDAALAGTIEVSAYLIGRNGTIVRDRRLVVVDPANDLAVDVEADAPTYLPGAEAKVSFRVRDAAGRGTAAALGVMVVDEAVFALQELQPGLEKVYFYLEREIATPRYEIHGYEIDGVVPLPGPTPEPLARREQAARVLLASAAGTGDFGLRVNTYDRDDKGSAFQGRMAEVLAPAYQKIQGALQQYAQKRRDQLKQPGAKGAAVADLVAAGALNPNDARDPWGAEMRIEGELCRSCGTYHQFALKSAGIDGRWETADDVVFSPAGRGAQKGGRMLAAMAAGGAVDMAMAEAMPKPAAAPMAMAEMAMAREDAPASAAAPSGAAAAEPVRLRQFFPETLYFNPAVITGPDGRGGITIPIADSITTWRMTCMASSLRGALGSTTAGLRVFQDFFVDVDFPVALTQHDEVSVPVAVYNYLKTPQQVRLVAEKGDWFEFKGASEHLVELGPSEVRAVYFPIRVGGVGFHKFTVTARGAQKSDAVARSVEVMPDGEPRVANFSGRLEGEASHEVTFPAEAIAGASRLFVKVYPGVLSQVVEGLERMLQMPGGCFEQTSSATYPNVLVLDYLKQTRKATPEVQMKAEGFINAGYQRLVSFEVPGGGFEWFGNPPAHRVLTAYGLMEFHDMSKVHEVDPALIARTQAWLAKGQEEDGSWKPAEGGIAEGAINAFQNDVLRTTAYVAWSLAYSGHRGVELDRALAWMRGRAAEAKDNFTLAIAANAFATAAPRDPATAEVLRRLAERRTEEKDAAYWKSEGETAMHGRGGAADIEVTGLAVQALVTAGRELGVAGKAVTWLARNKDQFGTWQSTQATIQALRAMLMAERGATQRANAGIVVSVDGKAVKTLRVDDSNSDVLQLVDLREHATAGTRKVTVGFEGEGSLMYQVVGRHYVPRAPAAGAVAGHDGEPLSIRVEYDRTKLATDDLLTVSATATLNRPGRAKMVILDLGLPPGFTLVPDELNKAVEAKAIRKYSATGRQIIVYLDELAEKKPVTVRYGLRAKYPLKAQTSPSVAYEYYDPSARGEARPVALEVTAR